MDPRLWMVTDKDEMLLAHLSDEPGEISPTKPPSLDAEPEDCAYATIQFYEEAHEPLFREMLAAAPDVDTFLEAVEQAGFTVREGRPKAGRIAKL